MSIDKSIACLIPSSSAIIYFQYHSILAELSKTHKPHRYTIVFSKTEVPYMEIILEANIFVSVPNFQQSPCAFSRMHGSVGVHPLGEDIYLNFQLENVGNLNQHTTRIANRHRTHAELPQESYVFHSCVVSDTETGSTFSPARLLSVVILNIQRAHPIVHVTSKIRQQKTILFLCT
ncbi:uncharacterized protein MELLADRAFT_108280 [Melampsora larici-populina 98AG31]|uniref:Uncharacterized protein n=1 Tax=Melampsora larici-populina (strain 98AG31 / pathotype 3-4-7) TaxID=747676 RepID=F4RSK2_MELLP|nr:uncharacterized protein MELLADRAFT_108280 [Melampsora larici-populina 98AG31]EGG04680.1 hypothetical protein MELLADRAFT_108280 [Melampsora larici-populina 98AG31]